jgi:hypothetical protein
VIGHPVGVGAEPDPLVEELVRARRDRQVIAIAVACGIVASVLLGLGAALGSLGDRNPGMLAYFVVPLALSLAIGYGVYWLRRRR